MFRILPGSGFVFIAVSTVLLVTNVKSENSKNSLRVIPIHSSSTYWTCWTRVDGNNLNPAEKCEILSTRK